MRTEDHYNTRSSLKAVAVEVVKATEEVAKATEEVVKATGAVEMGAAMGTQPQTYEWMWSHNCPTRPEMLHSPLCLWHPVGECNRVGFA